LVILFISLSHVIGGSVNLRWEPNPEPNVVGYRVHRGTSSTTYDWFTDVGLATQTSIDDLVPGETYYFVVTAWNDGGLESGPSNEVLYSVPGDAPTPLLGVEQLAETLEDTSIGIQLAASGGGERPLTFTITTQPTRGLLSGQAPAVSYKPNANVSGDDQFTFTVSDGVRTSPATTVRIRVAPQNDAPVATSRSVTGMEDTAIAIALSGTDLEGSALTFLVTRGPNSGSLTGSGSALSYIPKSDFAGRDSIEFRVSDGLAWSAPATVFINVTAVNDRPIAINGSLSVLEDSSVALVMTATDPDGPRQTFIVSKLPSRGILTGAVPNLVYTPGPDFAGVDSVGFIVTDGLSFSTPGTIEITVMPVDDPPTASPGTLSVVEDTPKALTLVGSDPDGDPLVYRITVAPKYGSLLGLGAEWTYKPSPNYFGPDRFEFTCTDGTRTTASTPVTIEVSAVNDAPVAWSQAISAGYGVSIPILLRGSDVEQSPLTFRIVANPMRGTLTGIPPLLAYLPFPGMTGDDTFSFVVNDGIRDSKVATVRVRVSLTLVSLRMPGVETSLAGLGDWMPAGDSEDGVASATSEMLVGVPDAVEWLERPQHGDAQLETSGALQYRYAADGASLDSFSYTPVAGGVRGEPVYVTVHAVGIRGISRVERAGRVLFPTIAGPTYTVEVSDGPSPSEGSWVPYATQNSTSAEMLEVSFGEPPPDGTRYVRIRCEDAGAGTAVESETWGIHAFQVPAGSSDQVYSVPLQGPICLRTDVSLVDSATVGLSRVLEEPVRVDEVTGNPSHILVIRSSRGRGHDGEWWPILEHANGTVRLDSRGESLNDRLEVGDEVEIQRLLTVADVFGRAGTSQIQLAGGDSLELESSDGTSYGLDYRLSNRGPGAYWVERGGTLVGGLDGTELPLLPAQALTFLRRVKDGEILVVGRVADGPFCHYLRTGERAVGNAYTAAVGIGELRSYMATANGEGETALDGDGQPVNLGAGRGLRLQIPESMVMLRWLQSRPW